MHELRLIGQSEIGDARPEFAATVRLERLVPSHSILGVLARLKFDVCIHALALDAIRDEVNAVVSRAPWVFFDAGELLEVMNNLRFGDEVDNLTFDQYNDRHWWSRKLTFVNLTTANMWGPCSEEASTKGKFAATSVKDGITPWPLPLLKGWVATLGATEISDGANRVSCFMDAPEASVALRSDPDPLVLGAWAWLMEPDTPTPEEVSETR